MTDILTDMKRNIAAAGDVLMYSPPLRTEQARELVVIVESLREDKRSLTRIVDDLSAQVNALNEALAGVVMAQNAELLDQLGDAPLTAEAEAEYSEMMHRLNDPNDDEPLTGDYGGAGSERCPECGVYDYAGEYYCPVCGGEL